MATLPGMLVDTDWLADNLGDDSLVILDCTVFLRLQPEGTAPKTGRNAWAAAHIPGSSYADLAKDLSDRDASIRFMMPPVEQFATAMSALGVDDSASVVCYDGAGSMWAARIWWMLRSFGFDNAAVLDGGWRKWQAEGRPVSTDATPSRAASFVPRPREGYFATKYDVLEAIEDGESCVIDSLGEDLHNGIAESPYGRAGHITSSVNVAAMSLVDPETHAFLPLPRVQELFEESGALDRERVITYCGGGIAASSDAFMLTMLGHENVSVYDASLLEWAPDPSLPMENPAGQ